MWMYILRAERLLKDNAQHLLNCDLTTDL